MKKGCLRPLPLQICSQSVKIYENENENCVTFTNGCLPDAKKRKKKGKEEGM